MSILIATCVSYEYSLRWKAIAPGGVHILTASPHLDTSTSAVDRRMPLNRMRTGLVDEFAGDLTVDVLWKRTCNGIKWRFNMSATIKDLAAAIP